MGTNDMSRRQRRQVQQQATDTAANTRDGFANLAARMGLGAQNVFSEGTYIFDLLTRNRIKLEAMYRGSWIVGAAVDSIAEDMTRAGINIKGDSQPEQIEQMQVAMTRLGVWHSLLEAIKWGRRYGGAGAMIVVDGQDPSTPLNVSTIGRGQFRGLRVFDRWQLQPSLQNIVVDGMDFGLPMFYDVISDVTTGQVSNVRIHHTRVIRQIGVQLPAYQAITEQMWGESVVERMYDRLVAFDTATSGAANLIQKAHLRTVQIDKLREVLAAGGKAEENLLQMFHHMRMLQTNEGLTLLDKEDTFQAHSYTFSGLSDMILQFGQQIAGATGIPLVRLFGQSPAGLSATGESDLRMYYDNVASQQESRLRDGLMRVLQVMHQSLFGTPAPQSFDFDFVALWQTSSKEKADISTAVTNTVVAAFNAGIISADVALQELKQSSESTGVFSNITQEEIDQAKTEPPPMPVEGLPQDEKPSMTDRIKAWLNG
jgi:phage-related protein (TIGR01555 family)